LRRSVKNYMQINARRLSVLVGFLCVMFFVIILRLFYLQIIQHEFFEEKSSDQRTRIITVAADRGDIFDRNKNLFATSIDVFSVYIVPVEIIEKEKTASALSKLLLCDYTQTLQLMNRKKSFLWLKRKISKELANKVGDLELAGVGLLKEKKRIYPKGHLASQIIGFAGLDNQGLSGVELGYDDILKGKEGRIVIESDPTGREIVTTKPREISPSTLGMNITLTIDESIQYISEKELSESVKKHGALDGSIIVMNAKTGEILAAAGYPDFDPNDYKKYSPKSWKLAPITDVYEPGSTFKVITAAAGLDAGLYQPDTVINCPESYKVGAATIKNSHHISPDPKIKTLCDVIGESINTGVLQIALKLGPDRFYNYIKKFGFGEYTDIGFPGEAAGILREPKYWYKPDIAMITFGQTLAITPLQLVDAYCAIANNGIRIKPILIKKVESTDGNYIKTFTTSEKCRVLAADTIPKIKEVMSTVVNKKNGTGKRARMPYWTACGKTGTAQKPQPGGGYYKDRYVSSFIGFAPIEDPQIVILVIINEPKDTIWGETTSAPVFSNVGRFALQRMNVGPSKSLITAEAKS